MNRGLDRQEAIDTVDPADMSIDEIATEYRKIKALQVTTEARRSALVTEYYGRKRHTP